MCTIAADCARVVESGLEPPSESPRLDFPHVSNIFPEISGQSFAGPTAGALKIASAVPKGRNFTKT